MTRPLLITDCDEVLLHMVSHFAEWLQEAHAITFTPAQESWAEAMRRADGSVVPGPEMWRLLGAFFDTEMPRQTLVPHAREALEKIGEVADIVVLTNLGDERQPHRVAQLDALGLRHAVVCNQGGKGPAVERLLAERQPPVAAFVDDIASHHASVAEHAPDVWRLHMIADAPLAGVLPPAPAAHARIDDWAEALPWLLERLQGQPAA
ncbi:hypothetical protein [Sphingomonas jatrophae]|uniref:FMN phosphatase YigB, HAD superfamily n=1 Tax=Sphingomonas jatrophae TaxID=1166337 RepID=A0A1I6LM89_9SPHN|nr:hypothetical protein [Sphingomonas jatrophae]SFS04565.1 hypothetical protein SAMN05192580_2958 [Sphingomonas jatrophae]